MDLKKAGVKNWYFLLEIKDISLCKIDPHAQDKDAHHTTLNKNEIQRVVFECKNNLWYYLREVCRIPEPGAPNGVPYKANRGNIAQAWCLLNGIDSWLCLTRQQGKTQSALALIAWCYSFGTTNSQFIFVNKDGDNAKENLRRLGAQIDVLPEYLRFESAMADEDGKIVKMKKNATKMVHPVTNNSIIVKPKATSYDSALSLARGLTAPLLHFDEPEFTNYIKTIVDNSVSTYNTAAERSKAAGSIYGRVFTCTPGDLDTKCGMDAQLLLESTVKWTEQMYNWTPEEREKYITANDSNRIVYIEYSYHQIGKTEKWFADISAQINDPLVVRREILLQRLRGSSTSPYPREDLDAIIEMEHKPIKEVFLQDYYRLEIYEELDKHTPYIVGVDCSTGTVSDNNAISVINPYNLHVAAEFECSYIGETAYENVIKELVMKHIPKAVLCIERNNVGDGIIDHLLHSQIVSNLYFDRNKDLVTEKMRENETTESLLKKKAQEKSFYGVWTGGTSREQMFAILSRHVNEKKEAFVAHNVIRDLSRLVKKSNGKIEAGAGSKEKILPENISLTSLLEVA
nr:MAG TPA: large terminase [Caudoviricetes sp.]